MGKNKKPKTSMREILKEIEQKEQNNINQAIGNDDIKSIFEQEKNDQIINSENYLCFNFSLITEKDDYNFNYIIKNKQLRDNNDFFRRFYHSLLEISNKKVKDIGKYPLNDRIVYNDFIKQTKKEFYYNVNQELSKETELISVKLGGPTNQRMILWKKNQDDNVLYVLGFQFTFNNPLYKH